MTLLQLRERALAILGDESYFETGNVTMVASAAVLNSHINAAYARAVNLLGKNGGYVTVNSDDITWSAGVEEKDLSIVLSAKPRAILFVGYYPGNNTTRPSLPVRMIGGGNPRYRYRGSTGHWGWDDDGTGPQRAMYLRGRYTLGFSRTPTQNMTIEVLSAPVVTTLAADGDLPVQLPEEHHEFIAQWSAYLVSGSENSSPAQISDVLMQLESDLIETARSYNQHSRSGIGLWGRC